jgi:putative intracellular protease/amidase
MKFQVILFNDFETLDAMGPVEVFGKLDKLYELEYYSLHGGMIKSSQNVRMETLPLSDIKEPGIILIPGGFGTRIEVDNEALINKIKGLAIDSPFVLTVCTGSALLARTGLLKGLKATTNKIAFEWVAGLAKDIEWVRKARWVKDGKFYTSSGVSAGIDMALGFIADQHGEIAGKIAWGIEYIWNKDRDNDPFGK